MGFFFFRKLDEYFLGYEDFVDIFFFLGGGGVGGGITKSDYIYRSLLYILWSFLKVKVQNVGYLFGLLKFQIFFRVLEIPDISWDERWMLGQSLRMKKK